MIKYFHGMKKNDGLGGANRKEKKNNFLLFSVFNRLNGKQKAVTQSQQTLFAGKLFLRAFFQGDNDISFERTFVTKCGEGERLIVFVPLISGGFEELIWVVSQTRKKQISIYFYFFC